MKSYTIFNSATQQRLELRSGVWYAFDLSEAEEMRDAARRYLEEMGLGHMREMVDIVEYETDDQDPGGP